MNYHITGINGSGRLTVALMVEAGVGFGLSLSWI